MKKVCSIFSLLAVSFTLASQCSPSIPSTALVVNTTTTNNSGFTPCWVCSGDTLISNGGIRDVFLEPGAVMTSGGGIDNIYVKNGAKFIMTGGIHTIYYENINDLTLSGGIPTTNFCAALTYNYSMAPANGCTPSTPLSVNVTKSSPTCHGGCDGWLKANATGGVPPYSYKWVGGSATATDSNLCAGNYTAIVTDALNNTDTVVTTLPDTPLVSVQATRGACIYYSFGGIVLTTSGNYTDTLISANGCDSIVNLQLTIGPVDKKVTKNGYTLTAVDTGVSYQWLDCDSGKTIISGATSRTYTGMPYKSYAVVLSNSYCTDTSGCIGISPAGIIEQSMNKTKIYPNPVHDRLYISSEIPFNTSRYELFNVHGKIVKSGYLNGNNVPIDCSGLEIGIYYLRIPDKNSTQKFIRK